MFKRRVVATSWESSAMTAKENRPTQQERNAVINKLRKRQKKDAKRNSK